MTRERLLLWPEMFLCNYKPPSSWPGNSVYHRGFSEDGVVHDALCAVKGTKPNPSGQLHAKTRAAQCLDCNLDIYINRRGGFCRLPPKKPQSPTPHTQASCSVSSQVVSLNGKERRAKAVKLYSYGCSQDWKYSYFAGTACKRMLWWPFGLRRQGCTGEMSDSSEETYNCYAPPPKKKKKILPKKPFASTELNAAIETVTRKITPTVRCQQKQSQVYACQTSSSQISLLFVQPFYPSRPFSVPPHCPLFPVWFLRVFHQSVLNFNFDAIFCNTSAPLGSPSNSKHGDTRLVNRGGDVRSAIYLLR